MNQTEDGHQVDPKELWKFHKYVHELHQFANDVRVTACNEGLSPDGFNEGILLQPLGTAFAELADNIVSPAFMEFMDKLDGMADAINKAAERYGLTDDMVAQGWDEMYNKVDE